MNDALCFLASYLCLQVSIFTSIHRLFMWDDPKWRPDSYAERQKRSKKIFAINWAIITCIAFFLDVGFLFYGFPIWLDFDSLNRLRSFPFLLIPLLLTFPKTAFLNSLWLTWRIACLEERLKKND